MLVTNDAVKCTYREERKRWPNTPAHIALARTHKRLGQGERSYLGPRPRFGSWNGAESDGLRWIEQARDSAGRFDGYADEVAKRDGWPRSIDHTGWFCSDDGDTGETMRGVVYRLPHGRGFIAGYEQIGFGDEGGARLDCRTIWKEAREAAREADRIAERCAEKERDYQAASNGAIRYADLLASIPEMRRAALKLCAERRELCRHLTANSFPAAARALGDAIRAAWAGIQEAREEAAEVREETRYRAPDAFDHA